MKICQDKIKHIAACAVIACVASAFEAALGAKFFMSLLAGIVAGMAIGVGKEYGDHCAPGNRWDWEDIAADAIGSIVGAILGSLLSIINQ